jgi:hypothetical protein
VDELRLHVPAQVGSLGVAQPRSPNPWWIEDQSRSHATLRSQPNVIVMPSGDRDTEQDPLDGRPTESEPQAVHRVDYGMSMTTSRPAPPAGDPDLDDLRRPVA